MHICDYSHGIHLIFQLILLLVLALEMKEMLKMAKKKQNKEKSTYIHEKRVNIRLTGFDLANYQMCGVGSTDVFRSGLYDISDENKKKKSAQEIKLKSQILKLNNEIIEDEMRLRANKLLLAELMKELNQIKGFTDKKRKYLIQSIKKEYFDFIDDEKYENCGLSDFYTIKRTDIDIYAMKVGIDYEQAVDVFDSYLKDEFEKQSVLENMKLSENE